MYFFSFLKEIDTTMDIDATVMSINAQLKRMIRIAYAH